MQKRKPARTPSNGLGVDAGGGPVVDPTANVVALVEAGEQRQDDLRVLLTKYLDARLDSQQAMAILVSNHQREIREIETKRVDAVQQVYVNATADAARTAATAIQTLALQQRTEAEALRSVVASTATTLAKQLADIVESLGRRLATLEQSAAMGAGKQAVEDPATARLAALVEKLATTQERRTGQAAGGTAMWGYVAAGFGFLLTLLSILSVGIGLLYVVLKQAPVVVP